MKTQSDNLHAGYSAVATAYPTLPGITNARDTESIIATTINSTNDVDTYLGNAQNAPTEILTGLLGGEMSTDFTNKLAAYKLGHYYVQLNATDAANVSQDNQDALNAYKIALTPAGVSHTDDESFQVNAVLTSLQTAMLADINAAMGLATNVESEAQRTVISNLNNDLLKQISNIEQLCSAVSDLDALSYTTFKQFPKQVNELNNLYDQQNEVIKPQVTLLQDSTKAGKGAWHHAVHCT
jgi:hypothetical protein